MKSKNAPKSCPNEGTMKIVQGFLVLVQKKFQNAKMPNVKVMCIWSVAAASRVGQCQKKDFIWSVLGWFKE
jgi:hypothetical protein